MFIECKVKDLAISKDTFLGRVFHKDAYQSQEWVLRSKQANTSLSPICMFRLYSKIWGIVCS